MQQLGWLRAIPDEHNKSRLASYIETETEIPLPTIEGYEYLVSLLESAGTILQTGMGIAPLTWQELESWERSYSKELDCWELSYWELSTIKDMSYAYCAELGAAKDINRQSPYTPVVIDREAVSRRIHDVFKSFMKNKKEDVVNG